MSEELEGRLLNARLALDIVLSGRSDSPAQKVADARDYIDEALEMVEGDHTVTNND